MDTAGLLEVAAHALTAMLGVWLGLTVLTRSGTPSSRVFAVLALEIATWSASIIVQRLTTAPDVGSVSHAIEEFAAALVIAGTAHLALSISSEGHPTARRQRIVALVYAGNLAFALPAIMDPGRPVAIGPPHFGGDLGIGALLGWGWIVMRLGTFALAAGWLLAASRATDRGDLRSRQVRAALATVLTGAIGGSLRFLPVVGEAPAFIGVSLITLAVVLATYAALSAGIFFGSAVADRAFRTSLLLGVGLFAIVGLLFGLDTAARHATGVDLPLFTVLALVVVVATYEPIASRARASLHGRSPRAVARDRLLRALGQPSLTARPAEAGVGPALLRLAAAVGVDGLTVVRPDGSEIASAGRGAKPGASAIAPIPLVADGEVLGELRVGAPEGAAALDSRDEELLRMSAAYVASALRTSRREEEHVDSLVGLTEQRAAVEQQATELHAALVQHEAAPPGLRVHALGPLRVERNGEDIRRWGGDKAGTRQAEALFAFLFDRGERGVAKDEALELVWPDVDLERADLAFHRTLVGLRNTLDPARGGKGAIRFHNDRYRLDPSVVAWSDVEEFLSLVEAARSATQPTERLVRLEEARGLYRGDYLDDCPFYGDSAWVEDGRALLRDRSVDILIALGEAHEAGGDRISAAAAFREAVQRAVNGCAPAQEGLARLGF